MVFGKNGNMTEKHYDYNDSIFPGPDPYAPLKDVPSFELTSDDVTNGAPLKTEQLAEDSISPHLAWSNLPEGTKSVAITCYDPDAPTGSGYWHWAALNIPANVTELPTNAGATADLGVGALSLNNDAGQREFFGAAPPAEHAPHRYIFVVHAVDVEKLDVEEDATPAVLGFNLHFHSIGRAMVWGWHETK